MDKNVYICGIDEAGRGPLAGPVHAAAVILGENFDTETLNDSKKLSAARREAARDLIRARALAWGIGCASAAEIDSINILQASLLAMERAFRQMVRALEESGIAANFFPFNIHAVADGIFAPDIPVPCAAVVKADALVPEVMAASILAKTERDREMERYAKLYPVYGYEKHKGYPTKEHRAAILKYGASPIQRLTFTVKPL